MRELVLLVVSVSEVLCHRLVRMLGLVTKANAVVAAAYVMNMAIVTAKLGHVGTMVTAISRPMTALMSGLTMTTQITIPAIMTGDLGPIQVDQMSVCVDFSCTVLMTYYGLSYPSGCWSTAPHAVVLTLMREHYYCVYLYMLCRLMY